MATLLLKILSLVLPEPATLPRDRAKGRTSNSWLLMLANYSQVKHLSTHGQAHPLFSPWPHPPPGPMFLAFTVESLYSGRWIWELAQKAALQAPPRATAQQSMSQALQVVLRLMSENHLIRVRLSTTQAYAGTVGLGMTL